MNGPLMMYRPRQIVVHDDNPGFELPKCMYKMRNIHSKRNGMVDDGDSADHVSKATEKSDIFDQNNLQISGMTELEAKQEEILKQLADLKRQILSIKSDLKISSTASPKKCPINASASCHPQKAITNYTDIVINASPEYPPYSLEAIQKLLKHIVNFSFTFHLHSTVSTLPENTKKLETLLKNSVANPEVPQFNVRLIWKNVGPNIELLVSQVPIVGEVNLLRYLTRTVCSCLSYSDDMNSSETDSLLDVIYLLVKATTKTERMSLLQVLNEALGKSEWLLGRKSIGIVDIAAYSAIKQCLSKNEINVNLGKWFVRCESFF